MGDIIATVPWHCGHEDGCEVGWHKRTFWQYADGTFSVDEYADGDHEDCDEADLPSVDDEAEAWQGYYRSVAKGRGDPLHEFNIRRVNARAHRFAATFSPSITGPYLVRVDRGRVELRLTDVPPPVLEYLCVDKRGKGWVCSVPWETLVGLHTVVVLRNGKARATFTLNIVTPRSPAAIRRDIIKAARTAINQKGV